MRITNLCSLVFICAAIVAAQEKVTVPLSNPSQPATVKVSLISGSITVTAGSAGQVTVETTKSTSNRATPPVPPAPPGMHRIDVDRSGLDVQEDHNMVSVSTGMFRQNAHIALQVPARCSLHLSTINGGVIDITGVEGELELSNMNGNIELKNVSGSVVASTTNGNITAALSRVTSDKPMSFTTLNGRIDVTLPGDTKARLRLKTDRGSVYSAFDVKMDPESGKPIVEDNRSEGGRYRIRMDHSVYGSINGGGPEYRFETMNGNITINKK